MLSCCRLGSGNFSRILNSTCLATADSTVLDASLTGVYAYYKTELVNCKISARGKQGSISGLQSAGTCIACNVVNCMIEGITAGANLETAVDNINFYFRNCVLKGYEYGGMRCVTKTKVTIKDCVLAGGVSPTGLSSFSSTARTCMIVETAHALSMDNCIFKVGDNVPSIMIVGSSTYDSVVNLSNCIIEKSGNQLIQLKSDLSEVNIGDGCNITDSMIDTSKGSVSYTNELYRYLEDSEQCSGKDLKVYFDYINKSVKGQLSSIVDGEVS